MLIHRAITVKRDPFDMIIPDLQHRSMLPMSIRVDNRQLHITLSLGNNSLKFSPSYLAIEDRINLEDYVRVFATSRNTDHRITLNNRTKQDQHCRVTISYEKHSGVLLQEGSHNELDMSHCLETLKGSRVLTLKISSGIENERLGGIRLNCVYPDLYPDITMQSDDDTIVYQVSPDQQQILHFYEFSPINPKVKCINLLSYCYN